MHRRYGPPDVLEVADVPEPVVGAHDVLVEVRAAAVNPVDVKMRSGSHRVVVPRRFPWVPGLDVSGVVGAVGAEVRAFAVGDEVFASPGHQRPGTYAERVVIDAREVAPKPVSLTHEQAASLPLVALTAWQCLAPHVRSGHRVFVRAGSGGVGTAAIQLARHLGAGFVATSCSARNHELVRSLGADLAIDYHTDEPADRLTDVDVALESLIGPPRRRLLPALRRGAVMPFVGGGLPEWVHRAGPYAGTVLAGLDSAAFVARARLAGIRAHMVVRRPDGAALATIRRLVDDGGLAPVVDRVFPMHEAADAHRYVERRHTRGKVVLAGFSQ